MCKIYLWAQKCILKIYTSRFKEFQHLLVFASPHGPFMPKRGGLHGAMTCRAMLAGAPAPGRVTHVKRGQRQDKFGPFPSQRLNRFA